MTGGVGYDILLSYRFSFFFSSFFFFPSASDDLGCILFCIDVMKVFWDGGWVCLVGKRSGARFGFMLTNMLN